MVDVIVEVPETILRLTKPGLEVKVKAGGKEMRGKIFAIIPKGDTATRTFPVKVRMNNPFFLVEGMEARVSLPSMESKKGLLVSRDAILMLSGKTVVFAVVEAKAKMIPVKVIGYQGSVVGIEGEGLSEGMKVVVKGNERLRDGQMVAVSPTK
jgi:multidrug efflux pump subunit AcrA (membrane-fusion protein)